MRTIWLLGILAVCSACSTARGFDRGALGADLAKSVEINDDDVRRVLELKPQIPRPFRLGVVFREGPRPRNEPYWAWQRDDKDTILAACEGLKRRGVVSDVAYIAPSMTPGQSLKSLRLAAAQHGADAVLVVGGVGDIDRYNNSLGPTYAFLVTALFVPGTVMDGLFVANGALWDVRNGYLYASMEVDGVSQQTRPAAFVSERDAVLEARADAMRKLAAEIDTRVIRLAP